MFYRLSIIVIVALVVASCSTVPEYSVNVSSLARSDSENKKSYVLLPGSKDVSPDDLQFQEYKNYVQRGLGSRGFVQNEKIENADIVIFLTYGISDPQSQTHSYSAPVWGQTGYSGATTTGSYTSYGSGYGSYSANTTLTPTYGVTGYTPQIETVTTFSRWLMLAGYDANSLVKDKKMEQVWKTSVVSTGSSGDLRRVMPVMVTTSWPYWGKNTGEAVSLSISEDDPSIQSLKTNSADRSVANEK
jgi:hypothetical protein